jgi:hypothetical protein
VHIDASSISKLTAQLRLVSKDVAICRKCFRDLARLQAVRELQAIATDYNIDGLVESVAPTLLQELEGAAKRLGKTVPQIVRGIEAMATAVNGNLPATTTIGEEE